MFHHDECSSSKDINLDGVKDQNKLCSQELGGEVTSFSARALHDLVRAQSDISDVPSALKRNLSLKQAPQMKMDAVELQKKEESSSRGKKGRRKRPMSAYNFFFKDERTRITSAISDSTSKADAIKFLRSIAPPEMSLDDETLGIGKSSSRDKVYKGVISFGNICKIIGYRWKNLDPEELAIYTKLAEEDTVEYLKEVKKHKRDQLILETARNNEVGEYFANQFPTCVDLGFAAAAASSPSRSLNEQKDILFNSSIAESRSSGYAPDVKLAVPTISQEEIWSGFLPQSMRLIGQTNFDMISAQLPISVFQENASFNGRVSSGLSPWTFGQLGISRTGRTDFQTLPDLPYRIREDIMSESNYMNLDAKRRSLLNSILLQRSIENQRQEQFVQDMIVQSILDRRQEHTSLDGFPPNTVANPTISSDTMRQLLLLSSHPQSAPLQRMGSQPIEHM